MRIACLQFAPQIGDVNNNLNRADAILDRANPENLDLLVLPQLAFTGYNFKSLNHISPYLEYTERGISSVWAQNAALKHDCIVTVGYPETIDVTDKWPADPEYYSSAITYNADGEPIVNYRKTFLYQIDERWALEGPGFFSGVIPGLGNVVLGICMDLNPYRLQAPWRDFEFANYIVRKKANLVILSMAWLTAPEEYSKREAQAPDMDALSYWLSRLEPLTRREEKGEVIVVFANRCGVEGDAFYAGTSAVLGIEGGEVKVYGILGGGENELLVVDTSEMPQAKLTTAAVSTPDKPNWDTPDSGIPIHKDSPGSINAILAASQPISPVTSRFPHAYYDPEPPRAEDLLYKLNSSAHLNDKLGKYDRSAIAKPSHNSPDSLHPSTASSFPSTNTSNSRKSRKSSRADTPHPEAVPRNAIQQSLVISMATVGLNPIIDDIPEPVSASSMTTHVPWDVRKKKERDLVPTDTEDKASSRPSSMTTHAPWVMKNQRKERKEEKREERREEKGEGRREEKREEMEKDWLSSHTEDGVSSRPLSMTTHVPWVTKDERKEMEERREKERREEEERRRAKEGRRGEREERRGEREGRRGKEEKGNDPVSALTEGNINLRQPSPFVTALQQATQRTGIESPKSQRTRSGTPTRSGTTSRSGTPTTKSQRRIRPEQKYQEPTSVPNDLYQAAEVAPAIVVSSEEGFASFRHSPR